MGLIAFDSSMLEAFENARDSAEIVKHLSAEAIGASVKKLLNCWLPARFPLRNMRSR